MQFFKYQGTGNDFILIDNRDNQFDKKDTNLINKLCDRRFGIGADGLILLDNDKVSDFAMVYYNSDGNQSTMCGNGGRCIVAFAKMLGLIDYQTTFSAIDGQHFASIDGNMVSLQMKDVAQVSTKKNYIFLDTGSPHHIEMVTNLAEYDVVHNGCTIRNSALYGKEGSNVNFVEKVSDSEFNLRTYERGVEDETLACGTGATAVAIGMFEIGEATSSKIKVNVKGGILKVSFDKKESIYTNVFLEGPATFVFKGEI